MFRSIERHHHVIILLALIMTWSGCARQDKTSAQPVNSSTMNSSQLMYPLPAPKTSSDISVEEALSKRRSHRSFLQQAISAEDLSQILWAAYGITQPLIGYPQTRGGLRTAPSAGALYPLELYVLVGQVKGIEPGVYKYDSQRHMIIQVMNKDVRAELASAALDQEMIRIAPASLFYSAVFSRTTQRYGDRGRERYVCMDAGHSAQNVYLQVEALHLGTCAIGAFEDARVKEVMQLPEEEEPLYIMPVGRYYDRPEF